MHIFSSLYPYTYQHMSQDILEIFKLATPFTRRDIIGCSEQGRPIPALLIGNPYSQRHFLIQGAIHGREYMTARLIMSLAQTLLSLKKERPNLLSLSCFHLLPMTNPDGVCISQQQQLPAALLPVYLQDTKNRPQPLRLYASRWKANGQGIDLNRNFPAHWEDLCGPAHPSGADYKGPFPLCALESRALAAYVQSYPFSATVSYHESGSEIYYEYGTRKDVIYQSRCLANEISKVTGYPVITSRPLAAGGFKDWAMEDMGIPSITVEIGQGPAPLNHREFKDIQCQNQYVPAAMLTWELSRR